MEFLEMAGSLIIAALTAALVGLAFAAFAKRLVSVVAAGKPTRQLMTQRVVFAVMTVLGFLWMLRADRSDRFLASPEAERLAGTIWSVILAVGVSAALFVAANVLFSQAGKSFPRFSALVGAVVGFVTFGLLDGNRLIQHINGRDALADSLHGIVNANDWTLLASSIVIATLIFAGFGRAAGTVRVNLVPWQVGSVVVGVVGGFLWGVFFAERIPVDTTISLLWTPVLGAALVAGLGFALAKLDQPFRLAAGVLGGAGIGLLAGGLAFSSIVPRIQVANAIIWPVGLAIVGALVSRLRGRPILGGALVGALIGWVVGVFVVTNAGGPRIEALSAFGVAGALAGARFSFNPRPNEVQRTRIETGARSWIFLAPALFFVFMGLIAPLIRTIFLSLENSFRDDDGQRVQEFPSLQNYGDIFGNASNWDFSNWRALFTSAPFEIGMLLVCVALVVAFLIGRRSGNSFRGARVIVPGIGVALLVAAFFEFRLIQDLGNSEEALLATTLVADGGAPSWRYLYLVLFLVVGLGLLLLSLSGGRIGAFGGIGGSGDGLSLDLGGTHAGAFAFGAFLIVTAVFAGIRGTVINSLWWVFAVAVISASFGLAIAALADRARLENVAKSIIFMPLAISFVGAGIIWRFMYIARPGTDPQTGLLNWVWLQLGDLSLSGSRWIGVVVVAAVISGLAMLGARGWYQGAYGLTGGSFALAVPLVWVVWRLAAGRLGGTGVDGSGERTVIFISQNLPYNNLWLMVVLIWIQTGFAMVIFSAAIKAVPQEFIEAAKVDGATDSAVFWRIIVPQIVPTIGVVGTTLVVTVLKIFDVVKVMTNGNFETQIVANEMFFQAFTAGNRGLGSALAVVLFVAVLPVVFFNVRRLQQEES